MASPQPESWAALPFSNSGDGLALAESVGGVVEDSMPMPLALGPVVPTSVGEGRIGAFPLFGTRQMPGCIAVTRQGRRFVNEAASYHVFARSLLEACRDEAAPMAFVICDHRALRRYGLGRVLPFPVPIARHLGSGELLRGNTLAELAAAAGIDGKTLEQTVSNYNATARIGQDPMFHRGESVYDRANGDGSMGANVNNGPLEHPPYYAVRVYAGSIGTFAGLKTNEHAQLIRGNGSVIEGVYAAGNDQSSITGGDYIGGGCTIGPAMTFGYVAARHAGRFLSGGRLVWVVFHCVS